MNRSMFRRCLVTLWTVWFIGGMTLAVGHRHDHADCARQGDVSEAAPAYVHACRHKHKHDHSHQRSEPAQSRRELPGRNDDCSLCQLLGLPQAAPPSITLVSEPAVVSPAEHAVRQQCEQPPAIFSASPRAPPQTAETSC